MPSHRIPDFFIAGAAKSGTTSLYHYLSQHPSIYMPTVKEPNYLAYRDRELNLRGPVKPERIREVLYMHTVTDEAAYLALFDEAQPEQMAGEASPRYLYYPNAVRNMAAMAPGARLILLLRDPVHRAHSHFRMNREFNLEPCRRFEQALALEPERTAAGFGWDWHYLGVSRYGEQVRRLLEYFPRQQIYASTYERFTADPALVCGEICDFLQLPAAPGLDFSSRHKVSQAASGWLAASLNHTRLSPAARTARALMPRALARRIKRQLLQWLASRAAAGNHLQPQTYADVTDTLNEDIALLRRLLAIDLGMWRCAQPRTISVGAESAAPA